MNIQELIEEVARTKAAAGRLTPAQSAARLSDALAEFTGTEENQTFAERFSPTTNYMRCLLNSPDEEVQIVLVFWGAGQGSPIHDHSGTIGAVSALTGECREIKYLITDRDERGVRLAEESSFLIVPGEVTTILPEEEKQLHLMANQTQRWAATLHIYLTAIHRYRLYEPQTDNIHLPVENELWFDRIDMWREMPQGLSATAPR